MAIQSPEQESKNPKQILEKPQIISNRENKARTGILTLVTGRQENHATVMIPHRQKKHTDLNRGGTKQTQVDAITNHKGGKHIGSKENYDTQRKATKIKQELRIPK